MSETIRATKPQKGNDGFVYRTFFFDDTGKNKLFVKQNDKIAVLHIKLGSMNKRLIGQVTKSTRTIEMNRKRAKHLYLKTNSYGFNDYVLRNNTTIDWVRLSDDKGNHWKVPVKYILEHGTYLHFKQQEFELQRFVSLEELEQFRVKPEENRRI